MKTICVTGGAGFIGSIMVPMLLQEGYSVTVIDNFYYDQISFLEYVKNPRLTIVYGDARDTDLLKEHTRSADIVIPLAAIVGAPASKYNKNDAVSLNYGSVASICSLLSPSQGVIYPGTDSSYGTGTNDGYCTEETPLKPLTLYGETKTNAENKVRERENSIVLRLATVFGLSPRPRLDLLINDFVHRACTDKFIVLFEPNYKRIFVHVTDVARAFIHAIRNFEQLRSNVFNVGLRSANVSKLELCDIIKKHIPDFIVKIDNFSADPDQRNYIVSTEKFEKTGYLPKMGLDEGIQELIKGYKYLKNNKFTNI